MDRSLTRFCLSGTRIPEYRLVKGKEKGDALRLDTGMWPFSLAQQTLTEWTEKLLTVSDLLFKHFADVLCSHHHPGQLEKG